MVVVAQLVRAPDCGSGGRRFETDLPPLIEKGQCNVVPFFMVSAMILILFKKTSWLGI